MWIDINTEPRQGNALRIECSYFMIAVADETLPMKMEASSVTMGYRKEQNIGDQGIRLDCAG